MSSEEVTSETYEEVKKLISSEKAKSIAEPIINAMAQGETGKETALALLQEHSGFFTAPVKGATETMKEGRKNTIGILSLIAAEFGQTEVYEKLHQFCDRLNFQHSSYHSRSGALHLAARNGHVDTVEFLLKQDGIKVDLQDRHLNTALHKVVRELGRNYNYPEYKGIYENIIIILLNNNADTKIPNKNGLTPKECFESIKTINKTPAYYEFIKWFKEVVKQGNEMKLTRESEKGEVVGNEEIEKKQASVVPEGGEIEEEDAKQTEKIKSLEAEVITSFLGANSSAMFKPASTQSTPTKPHTTIEEISGGEKRPRPSEAQDESQAKKKRRTTGGFRGFTSVTGYTAPILSEARSDQALQTKTTLTHT